MNKYLREPVNGLTHLIGAILSLVGLVLMIIKVNISQGSLIEYVSIILFGISMILLYSASATYHSVIADSKIIKHLKKVDHSMIFVLIAGSYAPFCLIALQNSIGNKLFIAVATSALVGIIFKICWVTCPKWLSSVIYITIGWFAIFAIYPLSIALSPIGVSLLVLGGLMYTIGGVIYALKKDKIKIGVFGSHEIFHVFIMLGTLFHFICVFNYII
ncbi:hemolysin III family protein [Clostridium botulinum]|uniref:Channel protein, hemolysin III family n=1 Tax=Clostridium botulinum (strain Eklund 17B / Type B) TaxID=935198 RepID=B2THF8_CLOBB|nr:MULTISPECIES: hemolysin III family protein [Clostridium]ACD23833.1 channel protein, hemolysin III family [Clostridium botulinum B str. Eklund 17B (NRP)]AIY80354.1 channel, hemolysin III family protein [Clostridium botulinum 202F]KAI3345264.1 hemolysin III family protein [Clostridium botulinum]KFX57764.1 hemolysin [Clostridium botulinum]KFX59962.1 hemolysin [Clostridium botulinum]